MSGTHLRKPGRHPGRFEGAAKRREGTAGLVVDTAESFLYAAGLGLYAVAAKGSAFKPILCRNF